MAPNLEKEYEKFLAENPNCDTTEIVEYFFALGYNTREKEVQIMREAEYPAHDYVGG